MLSFDRLHTFPGGLFHKHLWTKYIKPHVDALTRQERADIDDRYVLTLFRELLLTTNTRANGVPRWRDLNHFQNYLSVDFTDGSKWEDMSKVN